MTLREKPSGEPEDAEQYQHANGSGQESRKRHGESREDSIQGPDDEYQGGYRSKAPEAPGTAATSASRLRERALRGSRRLDLDDSRTLTRGRTAVHETAESKGLVARITQSPPAKAARWLRS